MKCVYLEDDGQGRKTKDGRSIFNCHIHGQCTIAGEANPYASCLTCKDKLLPNDLEGFQDPLTVVDRNMEQTHALRGLLAGGAAFLVCGGPSAKQLNLSLLEERGVFSLAINNMAGFCKPNAFVCSDPPSKFHHGIWLDPQIMKIIPIPKLKRSRGKLREKVGRKFQPLLDPKTDEKISTADCPNVWGFERRSWLQPDETFFTETSAAWGNHNSGVERTGEPKTVCTPLLGLRVLYYLGAREIFLVGMDMHMDPKAGLHDNYAFPQARDSGAVSSNNSQYKVVINWLQQMQDRKVFDKFGLKIYNCNEKSAVRAFPHIPFEEAIQHARKRIPEEPLDLRDWYEK